VSDNAAGGQGRAGTCLQRKAGMLFVRKSAVIIVGVALLAPLSAQAAPAADRPISNITRDVISFFGFGPDQAENPTDPALVPPAPRLESPMLAATHPAIPQVPALTAMAVVPPPSVEKPLHRLFCVEYARMRSGLAVFGDAKHWWERARNLYARLSHPVEEAVMVFSGSKRLKRGHVAVVTNIVGPRRITVDQANWQNHGEIDHSTPVLDVSPDNDWSRVRVWDMRSGQFGTHVYAISGFIAKDLVRQASRD
jgi:hypothetical protein